MADSCDGQPLSREPMGIAVMTLSPSVCAGPSGETAWSDGGLPDPSETDEPEWVSYTTLANSDTAQVARCS